MRKKIDNSEFKKELEKIEMEQYSFDKKSVFGLAGTGILNLGQLSIVGLKDKKLRDDFYEEIGLE